MNVDPACYDLADRFLSDNPALDTYANRGHLAEVIQQVLEDWLTDAQAEREEKGGPHPSRPSLNDTHAYADEPRPP